MHVSLMVDPSQHVWRFATLKISKRIAKKNTAWLSGEAPRDDITDVAPDLGGDVMRATAGCPARFRPRREPAGSLKGFAWNVFARANAFAGHAAVVRRDITRPLAPEGTNPYPQLKQSGSPRDRVGCPATGSARCQSSELNGGVHHELIAQYVPRRGIRAVVCADRSPTSRARRGAVPP